MYLRLAQFKSEGVCGQNPVSLQSVGSAGGADGSSGATAGAPGRRHEAAKNSSGHADPAA